MQRFYGKQITLGTSDAWLMSRSSQGASILYWWLSDFNKSASLPGSLVNVLSFCKNPTYSMFSIFLMLLLSSHRVFSPMYSSKPSMVWKPLWCKYRTVLSLGVIYKLFCRQCSWKEDRKNQSISWFSPVVHSGMELFLAG